MSREIHIEPVTRIEGHAKITVFLDDAGDVRDAQFHVTELRGFERFCQGRTLWEMPGLTRASISNVIKSICFMCWVLPIGVLSLLNTYLPCDRSSAGQARLISEDIGSRWQAGSRDDQ